MLRVRHWRITELWLKGLIGVVCGAWEQTVSLRRCYLGLNDRVPDDHRRIDPGCRQYSVLKKSCNARRILIGVELLQNFIKAVLSVAQLGDTLDTIWRLDTIWKYVLAAWVGRCSNTPVFWRRRDPECALS